MTEVISEISPPLKIWEQLEILVGEGADRGVYKSRIEDFSNEFIIVSDPSYISGSVLLKDGIEVAVRVIRQDAIYQFDSRIFRKTEKDKKEAQLTSPVIYQRIQRREFFRLEMRGNVSYSKIPPMKRLSSRRKQFSWRKSYCINISAGGLLMSINDEASPGELLLLKIEVFGKIGLPDVIAGICRRVYQNEGKIFCGIQFIKANRLSEHFQESILHKLPPSVAKFDDQAQNEFVNYVFREQVERHNRGQA